MRFKRIAPNIKAGFHSGDAIIDNQSDRHFSQAHPDHFSDANGSIGDAGSEPGCEKFEKDDRQDKGEQRQYSDTDKVKRFHIATRLSEAKPRAKYYLVPRARLEP